jgi:2-methylcitrate dehydratase PrpD
VGHPQPHEPGATTVLAEWIAGMGRAPLPEDVVHQTRRILLDHLAAGVAGAVTPTAAAVRDVVEEMYPGDAATIIGAGRASAAGAALANGTAAHALDADDGYTPGSVHPSAPTLPAVLAAAEACGADPGTVLRAAAIGVEVTCRLARSGHPATRQAGFHNTALAGVFGAAAGVSVVLGLDPATTASALGVAGSHAGGLFEFLGGGAEVKRLHAGKAARDGLLSAYLARRGVSGPVTVLEGTNGYFHAFARDDWRPGDLLDGLGRQWALLDTYFKPYPCCRHLHGPIDALLRIRAETGLDAADVSEVLVETYSIAAAHDHTTAGTLLDAQMSLPYAVAVSLLDGQVGLEQFDRAHRERAAATDLAQRVRVRATAGMDARYPRERPARVTVRRAGRPDLWAEVDQPLGEPSRPFDDAAMSAKFHLLTDPILGPARADAVIDAVRAFDDLPGLLALLAPTPQ